MRGNVIITTSIAALCRIFGKNGGIEYLARQSDGSIANVHHEDLAAVTKIFNELEDYHLYIIALRCEGNNHYEIYHLVLGLNQVDAKIIYRKFVETQDSDDVYIIGEIEFRFNEDLTNTTKLLERHLPKSKMDLLMQYAVNDAVEDTANIIKKEVGNTISEQKLPEIATFQMINEINDKIQDIVDSKIMKTEQQEIKPVELKFEEFPNPELPPAIYVGQYPRPALIPFMLKSILEEYKESTDGRRKEIKEEINKLYKETVLNYE